MVSLELAPEYGYVVLAATSAFILNTAHTLNTGIYRKAAKVDYPAPYAPSSDTSPEAIRFNCAQRSHANYVENVVIVLPSLLIAGLKFPLTSAALGFFWTASRWSYMVGYSKGGQGGKGRYKNGGLLFWFAQLGLLGLSVYNGVTMILNK